MIERIKLERQSYTVQEVARITGYSVETVRQLALAKVIPAKITRMPGSSKYAYRFPKRPFDAWWDAGGTEIVEIGAGVELEVS